MTDEREKYLREHGSDRMKELFAEIDRLRVWSSDSHVNDLESECKSLRAELKRVVAKAEEDYARLEDTAKEVIRERDQLKVECERLHCQPDCKAMLELIDRLEAENGELQEHRDIYNQNRKDLLATNEKLRERVEGLSTVCEISCMTKVLCQLQEPCRFCQALAQFGPDKELK